LNFNPRFKKLRNEITEFMADLSRESRQLQINDSYELPALEPLRLPA
jgi:nitrate/nitrite transport system ATP-binding protein